MKTFKELKNGEFFRITGDVDTDLYICVKVKNSYYTVNLSNRLTICMNDRFDLQVKPVEIHLPFRSKRNLEENQFLLFVNSQSEILIVTDFALDESTYQDLSEMEGVERLLIEGKYNITFLVGRLFNANNIAEEIRKYLVSLGAKEVTTLTKNNLK